MLLCVNICVCACTNVFLIFPQYLTWPSPREKPQYFQTRKKNRLFGWKFPGQRRSFYSLFFFFVTIIYSWDVDNAPTQTLQGIIHSACGDVAVPQIVQTNGQSPEPHNSKSYGMKKKKPCAHHCILILRISPSGTKCILTSLTALDRREPRTSEFSVIISHSPQATAS